jgi:1-acyl-sn-glycerol-3-phosphate acyltransferase
MIVIRSFCFYVILYTGTLLMGVFLLPTLIIKRPLFVPRLFAGYTRFLLKYVAGLGVEIEGLENIPKDNTFLIVSNHQSAWETLVFFTIFKNPVMILKKELLSVPLFGWFLIRTGMIAIDRKNAASSFKALLRNIDQRLKDEQRPVCIFPEGTRNQPGQPGDFQKGVYLIHKHTKAPILCVAHNAGLYWRPHKFFIQPGKVKVFIYPVLPAVFDDDILKTIVPGMIQSKAKELAKIGDKKHE